MSTKRSRSIRCFQLPDNEKIAVWKTKLLSVPILGVAGRINLKRDYGVVVICKDKGILVTEIRFKDLKKESGPLTILEFVEIVLQRASASIDTEYEIFSKSVQHEWWHYATMIGGLK